MTRQEQIEEIKQVLIKTCKRCRPFEEDYMQSKYAESLYNAGYRKIPEDTVVLTREEYEKLKNESIDKLFADDTFFKEEFKVTKEYLRKIANRDYIKLVKGQVRKETAKEILNMGKKLYEMSYHKSNAMPRLMEWIKVEYGVEIGEENGK